MKAKVTRIKDLKAVLIDLEPHVRNPDSLRAGREFRNFGLRPRELLANLLICFSGNYEDASNRLTVCTDPGGGDGLVYNQKTGKYMTMEHVFIPASGLVKGGSLKDQIIEAVDHKSAKGSTYAEGKDLVIFSDHGGGKWMPSEVAKKLAGRHRFENVWVVHLEKVELGYSYIVSWLHPDGVAIVWRVLIHPDFTDWIVERV